MGENLADSWDSSTPILTLDMCIEVSKIIHYD